MIKSKKSERYALYTFAMLIGELIMMTLSFKFYDIVFDKELGDNLFVNVGYCIVSVTSFLIFLVFAVTTLVFSFSVIANADEKEEDNYIKQLFKNITN